MKKVLKIIIYLLAFFIIYFLQISFFEGFKIAGVKPNIFIIAIIIIGLYTKPIKSFAIGAVCGIIIDILNGKAIGLTAICLGTLGYGIANVEKMFSIESKLSLIIFIFTGTIGYEVLNDFLQIIVLDARFNILKLLEIMLIEAIYNVILTIIFYPLCKKILKIGTEEVQENRIDGYLKRMR